MRNNKEKIEFYIDPAIKQKFQVYAESQGLTVSGYLRNFRIRTLNEEKDKINHERDE